MAGSTDAAGAAEEQAGAAGNAGDGAQTGGETEHARQGEGGDMRACVREMRGRH